MGVKESLGESKNFLLLAFALALLSIFVMLAMNSGIYKPSVDRIYNKRTYEEPRYVLEEGIDYNILINTEYGEIQIDLYEDVAPENVNSLLFLVGERYYEGLIFHKVIKNFVAQTGDTKGDGTGNPGYEIAKENVIPFNDYDIGMVNASQFFIVLSNSSKKELDGNYSVIGKVIKGFAVLDAIQKAEIDKDYRPQNDIVIKSIQILEE